MSAAELRQAAETLRERAKAATPGPWEANWEECDGWWSITGAPHDGLVCPEVTTDDARGGEDAAYIATMHPGVGLALAEHLEELADFLDSFGPGYADRITPLSADTLARLINGGAS